MEKLIKQKLIERGFKKETLLNNRGLIGACIEETEQQLRFDSLTSKEANTEKAKEVAIKEINKRIVTKDQAKTDFKKWIKETSSRGGFDKYILDFWDEVIKQVDKL